MAQPPALRASLTGVALVRLLEGLIDPRRGVREARGAFAQGLVAWTGWADAIALSAALERPATPVATAPIDDNAARDDAQGPDVGEACERLRALMVQAIAREVAATGRSPMDASMGFTPFRQRYLTRQQAMEVAIAALREQVRRQVAARSTELARLAAVDAVMAQVLSAQERRLLATVPGMLDKHYQRLRAAQDSEATGAATAAWVDAFRQDMQAVLVAELELRLQPVLGLLDALQSTPNPV